VLTAGSELEQLGDIARDSSVAGPMSVPTRPCRCGTIAGRARLEAEAAGVRALMAAIQARDSYTAAHSRSVVALAGKVARVLGCDADEIRRIELVALLHDVGKLRIPDEILNRCGPLDAGEWAVMRTHAAAGASIVADIPELAALAPAIRAEHERWDGTGYPDGLAGHQIPLASCITLACDAYHAMTSDRPYRPAMAPEAAMQELRRHAGTQFAPRPTEALLAVLRG
jgi:putative nucleotidyltransferase with HDIG domain